MLKSVFFYSAIEAPGALQYWGQVNAQETSHLKLQNREATSKEARAHDTAFWQETVIKS